MPTNPKDEAEALAALERALSPLRAKVQAGKPLSRKEVEDYHKKVASLSMKLVVMASW